MMEIVNKLPGFYSCWIVARQFSWEAMGTGQQHGVGARAHTLGGCSTSCLFLNLI
jgi:hypothetical protein